MTDKNEITSRLASQGYTDRSAALVAAELMQLSPRLAPCLEAWMEGGERDYAYHGYSIMQLMNERGMTYPAALLTVDWLIKEPDKAMVSLERGRR